MRRIGEISFSLLVVGLLLWVVAQASGWAVNQAIGTSLPRGWGPRSGLFPTVIGIPTLVLAIAQLLVVVRGGTRNVVGGEAAAPEYALTAAEVRRRSAIIIVTILGFVVATWLLGFTAAIPLMTLLYLRFGAAESWRLAGLLAVIAGVFFYGVFVLGLHVPVPWGPLLVPVFEPE